MSTLLFNCSFSLASLSQFIKAAIACGIFLSYPLNGFVFITIVFSDYGDKVVEHKCRTTAEYLVRLSFLLLTGRCSSRTFSVPIFLFLSSSPLQASSLLWCPIWLP